MTACLLPDGRRLTVAAEVAARVCAGVIVLDPVTPAATDAAAAAAEDLGRAYAARYADVPPSRIPGLAEARDLYKSFNMEPTRHRPSSEALLRRLLQGKGLYRISNLVDSCNLASLTFLLPIGLYDLDRVVGDVVLRAGREGEQYPGIRKGDVHLAGRLGLFDAEGPFGSPTSDSARTCTHDATRRLLGVVMATGGYPRAQMAANLDEFGAIFARHCDGVAVFTAVLGGAS